MLKKIVTPDGATSLERIDLSKTISANSITDQDATPIPVTGILPVANGGTGTNTYISPRLGVRLNTQRYFRTNSFRVGTGNFLSFSFLVTVAWFIDGIEENTDNYLLTFRIADNEIAIRAYTSLSDKFNTLFYIDKIGITDDGNGYRTLYFEFNRQSGSWSFPSICQINTTPGFNAVIASIEAVNSVPSYYGSVNVAPRRGGYFHDLTNGSVSGGTAFIRDMGSASNWYTTDLDFNNFSFLLRKSTVSGSMNITLYAISGGNGPGIFNHKNWESLYVGAVRVFAAEYYGGQTDNLALTASTGGNWLNYQAPGYLFNNRADFTRSSPWKDAMAQESSTNNMIKYNNGFICIMLIFAGKSASKDLYWNRICG